MIAIELVSQDVQLLQTRTCYGMYTSYLITDRLDQDDWKVQWKNQWRNDELTFTSSVICGTGHDQGKKTKVFYISIQI